MSRLFVFIVAAVLAGGLAAQGQTAIQSGNQNILFDRIGGVPMTPDTSIPAESLRSSQTRTVVTQPHGRINVDIGAGYPQAFSTTGGGRSVGFDMQMPEDYNRTRHYSAGPVLTYQAPRVVERQTTIVQPSTEYDVYSIGNVVKAQRVYTRGEREYERPAVVYDCYPWHAVDIAPSQWGVVSVPAEKVTETETRMETLSAERSALPHFNQVRMLGADGQVYLVSADELRPRPAGEVTVGAWESRPVWTPERIEVAGK